MKPSGLLWGSSLITFSIAFIGVDMFKLSKSNHLSSGSLYFSRESSILFSFQLSMDVWKVVSYDFFLGFLLFKWIFPPSHLLFGKVLPSLSFSLLSQWFLYFNNFLRYRILSWLDLLFFLFPGSLFSIFIFIISLLVFFLGVFCCSFSSFFDLGIFPFISSLPFYW